MDVDKYLSTCICQYSFTFCINNITLDIICVIVCSVQDMGGSDMIGDNPTSVCILKDP